MFMTDEDSSIGLNRSQVTQNIFDKTNQSHIQMIDEGPSLQERQYASDNESGTTINSVKNRAEEGVLKEIYVGFEKGPQENVQAIKVKMEIQNPKINPQVQKTHTAPRRPPSMSKTNRAARITALNTSNVNVKPVELSRPTTSKILDTSSSNIRSKMISSGLRPAGLGTSQVAKRSEIPEQKTSFSSMIQQNSSNKQMFRNTSKFIRNKQ